jgi:hypothetical protein
MSVNGLLTTAVVNCASGERPPPYNLCNVHATRLTSVVLLAVASVTLSAQSVPESCGVRDWFQLHDKVAQGGSSLLCKGAMDAAFENLIAESRLYDPIESAPSANRRAQPPVQPSRPTPAPC